MERYKGKYALIQFCPVPERLEALNIGLLVLVEEQGFIGIRFARGSRRVEKLFGKQPKAYLDAIKASFENRIFLELSKAPDGSSLPEFARKRANDLRLSALQPVVIDDPERDFERLFQELVGDDVSQSREPRMRRRLRDAFVSHKVMQFLDEPEGVDLPEYGLSVSVPFGYQNGCYNLIDAMKLPAVPSDALKEAGKRAIEGGLIWKHFEHSHNCKRLVVVGDFRDQSNAFYHAVDAQLADANVKLYRFDDLAPLFADIVENARHHGKIHS